MFRATKNNRLTSRQPKVKAGTYKCNVRTAEFDEEYNDGDAVRYTYDLTDENGRKFEFSEIFWMTDNDRTLAMDKYLEDSGVETWFDFAGCQEEVIIKKSVQGYGRLTIVDRKFITHPEEVNEDAE